MITEQAIKNWMRQQLAEKQYDNAAALAREFLEQHQIRDVLSPEFNRVISVGFELAPEIAHYAKPQ
jgi:hypothetical protein